MDGTPEGKEMAGVHGNRTHRGRLKTPPTGFEDQAAHQHRTTPPLSGNKKVTKRFDSGKGLPGQARLPGGEPPAAPR